MPREGNSTKVAHRAAFVAFRCRLTDETYAALLRKLAHHQDVEPPLALRRNINDFFDQSQGIDSADYVPNSGCIGLALNVSPGQSNYG